MIFQKQISIKALVLAALAGIGCSVFSAPKTTDAPKKLNVAVMTMKNSSGINEGEAGLISDRLRGELFNTGRANVMEREQMQSILKEQGFQQSGACTDEACLVQMGQLLGVEAIISGSIGKIGNMYLVNLRIIDVATGRLTQVVSEDIKGDLEELVGRLPNIAQRLVAPVTSAPAQPQPEPQPVIQTQPQPQPAPAPQPQVETVAPAEAAPATIDGEKMEKNKNRGGIRLIYTWSPGDPAFFWDDRKTAYKMKSGGLSRFDVMFLIKAGPFLNVNIGPAFSWTGKTMDTTYWDTSSYTYITESQTEAVRLASITPGLNYVLRLYPLKVNAGIDADFNFLFYSYNYTSDYYANDDVFRFSFNVGFSARAGAEIMVGPHVGFSMDLVYRFAKGTLSEDLNASSSFTEPAMKVQMQPFGFGFGANFYF